MPQAKYPFSFPIFYSVVFRDNSFLKSQGDIVNIILFGHPLTGSHSGEATISVQTSNHYTLGRRPIPDSYRVGLFELPTETVVERIRQCHIKNLQAAANGIVALIQGEDVSFSRQKAESLLEWYRSENEETFIAKGLIASMECEYSCDGPLDQDDITLLVSYRDLPNSQSKTEKTAPAKAETESKAINNDVNEIESTSDYDPGAVVQDISVLHDKMNTVFEPSFPEENRHPTEWPDPNGPLCAHSYYEFRRLTYAKEFKRLDRFFREFQPFDDDMKYPAESVDAFRSIFYRSKATFEIKVIGDYCGITDAVLSRVKRNSCAQMTFIVKLQGRTPLSLLRSTLQNIIHFALAEYGYVLFSYAQDDHVPLRQFAVTCIYSINEFSGDDELRQESVFDHNGLLPVEDYRKSNGRIPAFFGPISTKNDGYDVQRERWLKKPK